MKILVVTNTYPPADISGVGALVYQLARQLHADPEHEVMVLTREMATRDPWVVMAGASKRRFPLAAALKGLRLCWRHRFDLVHVHESDGGLLCVLLRLARWLCLPYGKTRVVATLQVSYDEEKRSVRPVHDRGKPLSQPTPEELSFGGWRAPLLARLGRWTARWSDAVVAPSQRTKLEIERDYSTRVEKVIWNGVALPPRAPARPLPEAGESDSPVVLYAGRLRTRKAVAVLVQALAKVVAKEHHPAARLLLAGEGDQRAALEKQVAELGLGASVEFLGAKDPKEMPALYAKADIFCLPSIYEGLPLAILEAMAHGLPVVTTNVSGMPDAVVAGETGLLVPIEDSDALADALIELLDDPRRRRAMGEAGRRRVEQHFTIGTIAGKYLELWRKLLGEG